MERIELKITLDEKGQKINLDELSDSAAQSLIIFLTALKNITKLTSIDGEDYKIQIQTGSCVIATELPKAHYERIELGLDEVINQKSVNNELVASWRDIQKVIKENGLTYEVNFNTTPLIDKFKKQKVFRVKSSREDVEYSLQFYKGKLNAVGGVNPNFHLHTDKGAVKISCNEEEAIKVKKFLYLGIMVSAWMRNTDKSLEFCDMYIKDTTYDYFNEMNNKLIKANDDEQMKEVFYGMKELLDKGSYGFTAKFMRMFCHKGLYLGNLKTILIITKSFKENEKLKKNRQQIKEIYDSIIKPIV